MKQKDWFLIVIIVFISAILSFVLSGILIKPAKKGDKVEVVESISSEFPQPDPKYFNLTSVDPTQVIRIGDNNNTTPFNKVAQ